MQSALSLWTSTPAQLFARYSEVLARRRRIGTPHPEEIRSFFMEQTAAGFSCLSGAFGVRPWQALSFIAWLNAPAQQVDPAVQSAGRFLLSVWGPKTDWRAQGLVGWRPFDMNEALDVWSTVDRQAFERWLDAPVWP